MSHFLLFRLPASTKAIPPIPAAVWQNPLYFIAFGFGVGTIPFAPGTCATLMAIPFYLTLQTLPSYLYIILVLLFALMSMWLSE